jgi:hypothetical protein
MSQILSNYLRQELTNALNQQYGSALNENASITAAVSSSIQNLSNAIAVAVNRYLVSNVRVSNTDLQITGTIAKTDISGSVTNEPVSISIDPNPHNHTLTAP